MLAKLLATTTLIAATFTATLACSAPPAPTPTPVNGIIIPFPEEGNQYKMSEVCNHLKDNGYNVKGTLHHTFNTNAFDDLLESIPALVRQPLQNYLDDGLSVSVEINSLCEALED